MLKHKDKSQQHHLQTYMRSAMAGKDRRLQDRFETQVAAVIIGRDSHDDEHECAMLDYSDGGARLQLNDYFTAPEMFLLRVPPNKTVRLAQVKWRRNGQVGVEFVEPEALSAKLEFLHAQIETLKLRMNNLRNFVERRLAGAEA